jgi:hypothetical protein
MTRPSHQLIHSGKSVESQNGKKRCPTHGNAFVSVGKHAWRFVDVFSRFGRIVMSFNGRLGLVVTPSEGRE